MNVDPRNIELCDDATVAMYRAMTGPQKLRILDGMYRSAVKFVRGGVMAEHPDWGPEQIERETMLRIARETH